MKKYFERIFVVSSRVCVNLCICIFQLLREKQPQGPYHICGYSFGACIAFEMCLQLELSNTPVAALSLLDGSHAYVAAHTGRYKAKLRDTAREQSEALCAFTLQFTPVDYNNVSCTFIINVF